jgi:hypothetical protein
VIAGNIGVSDLVALDTTLAGSIMKRVPDGALNDFADDRVDAALVALEANLFGSGNRGFSDIAGGNTVFD